jgi:tRNA A37 threonylcarbamoyladenosine modification protein TsaB
MFLFLNNREEGELVISAWMNNKIVQRNYAVKKNNDFLLCLENFLSSQKSILKDLNGLGVVMGVGRFTATRLLVTMANALAYSLKIPVLRLDHNFDMQTALAQIKKVKIGEYILPVYSSEPHINFKSK